MPRGIPSSSAPQAPLPVYAPKTARSSSNKQRPHHARRSQPAMTSPRRQPTIYNANRGPGQNLNNGVRLGFGSVAVAGAYGAVASAAEGNYKGAAMNAAGAAVSAASYYAMRWKDGFPPIGG